ncbi:class I SAM-dependent methyltransferase [Clostridiaceae bacterium M8S5]|nr:class I SAM-dependent methyltransferase [Clostridiaceae bacterium M8S5]
MEKQKMYWKKVYESMSSCKVSYDLWLDKHKDLLESSKHLPIIDLGCGIGNNTLYLLERGFKIISCDFCQEALDKLSKNSGNVDTRCFDMKDGLPFKDECSKIVISDLSLHYFTWEKTKEILNEISRVLTKEGALLCRVNSLHDINYGAGDGLKIESNYYNIDGKLKRFFDESDVFKLFREWNITYHKETEINRYDKLKIAWEICAYKTNKNEIVYGIKIR